MTMRLHQIDFCVLARKMSYRLGFDKFLVGPLGTRVPSHLFISRFGAEMSRLRDYRLVPADVQRCFGEGKRHARGQRGERLGYLHGNCNPVTAVEVCGIAWPLICCRGRLLNGTILIYGATGYTGKLIARAASDRGARPKSKGSPSPLV
jgi:hypothetical protein